MVDFCIRYEVWIKIHFVCVFNIQPTASIWKSISPLNSFYILCFGYKITTKVVEVMKFQLSYLKSWKMMLLKCCSEYASRFGKLSSGHKTGKGQFSFQSQRWAMPKNIQTTIQLHSFHMLASWFSKSFKLGFSSMWTENFQMYKLDLEKTEEPEIKLLTSTVS